MAETSGSRLELLYRISQTINSSLDLDVVMESLMDEVILATHAELHDVAPRLRTTPSDLDGSRRA